jgi:hypothetical protein
MSTEMSIFKNGGSIPAHLQRTELSATTRALMGGSDSRRISVKGNIFRMVVNGQEIAKNEDRAMNIIIAAAAPKTSRTYFAAVYQEGVALAPECWSNDGITPDKSSSGKQSTACATCPQNIAGSGQGTSKKCRYTHRLAVLLENDAIDGELYELSLAATSIFGKGENNKMPLFQYAKLLGAKGLNITDVVTEMRFDTDSATPKMVFTPVRALDVDELAAVHKHGVSPEAVSAITATYSAPKKVLDDSEELSFVEKPVKKPVVVEAIAEPVVRPKKATPVPTTMEDVLSEWGE